VPGKLSGCEADKRLSAGQRYWKGGYGTGIERRIIMILVNTDYITGKELEMLGLVKGSTIQSKNFGKDLTQGLKTLVGGELKAYTEMMNEARDLATRRMVEEAERLKADAVINIRYASSAIMQGAAEVMAYGTAVRFTS